MNTKVLVSQSPITSHGLLCITVCWRNCGNKFIFPLFSIAKLNGSSKANAYYVIRCISILLFFVHLKNAVACHKNNFQFIFVEILSPEIALLIRMRPDLNFTDFHSEFCLFFRLRVLIENYERKKIDELSSDFINFFALRGSQKKTFQVLSELSASKEMNYVFLWKRKNILAKVSSIRVRSFIFLGKTFNLLFHAS